MKVAVWYDERYGPAVAATIPGDDEPPEFASIPRHLPQGIRQQYLGKGSELDWEEWAEHLTERLPHHGQWSIEDVPDGMTPRQALSQVRSDSGQRASGTAKAPAPA